MNKWYKLFILILIFVFVGCTKKEDYKKEKIIVKNTNTINYIKNNIVSMQLINKTIEIYKNGNGTREDYIDSDMLLFGLNYVFASKSLNDSSKIPTIDGKDVSTVISNLFDKEVYYDTIGTCPNYVYNPKYNIFYVKYNCSNESNLSIITYIDQITLDNDY